MWALLPLVFYSLSVGKQPRYVLPVLPPLALLLASSIVERTQEWRGFDGVRSMPRRALPVVVGSLAERHRSSSRWRCCSIARSRC